MDVQITTAIRLKFKLLHLDTYVTLEHKTLSRWGIFVAKAKNTLYRSKF